ncbi:MAG: hypothetical protein ACRDHW_12855 [Ktedonobacteraceae bacterium]
MATNITEHNLFGGQEENGYDVPFAMFTWATWLEMQTQTMLRFARFQRAIESRHIQEAAAIMQEMVLEWQKEVASWITSHPGEC